MADTQDVLDQASTTNRGGETRDAWGGDPGTDYGAAISPENPMGYTGGWTVDDERANGGVLMRNPTDYAAYRAAVAAARTPSARERDVDRYRQMGEFAANRTAPWIDYDRANGYLGQADNYLGSAGGDFGYGRDALQQGFADRSQAQVARGSQVEALGMQRSAALGEQPSRAELLGRSMIDQSLAGQMAAASGAHGGAMAQAAAMRDASNGAAAFRQQGLGQLAAMRAGEMSDARNAYMAGASGVRGQDYGAADQATRMSGAYGSLGQAMAGVGQGYNQLAQTAGGQSAAQAQLQFQQGALNQAGQQFYEGQAFNVNQAALQAGLASKGADQQALQFGRQIDEQQRQDTYNLVGAGIAGGTTMGAAMATKKADGGAIHPGQPYLVGERGPELIIPRQGGTVIPAEQTPQVMALYEPPGQMLQQSYDGHAYLASAPDQYDGRPSLVSRTPDRRPQLAAAAAQMTRSRMQPAPQRQRQMTPAEMRAAADKLEAQQRNDHQARMSRGPAAREPIDLGDVDAPDFARATDQKRAPQIIDAGELDDVRPTGPQPMPTYLAQPRDYRALPNYSGRLAGYREPLMGGREDPYAPSGPPLMGGREDPYR